MFKETVKALSEIDLPPLDDDALSRLLNEETDLWICPVTKKTFPSSETEKIAAHKKELVEEIRKRRTSINESRLRNQADENFRKACAEVRRSKDPGTWIANIKKAWVAMLVEQSILKSKGFPDVEKYSDDLQVILPKIYTSLDTPYPTPLVVLRCSAKKGEDEDFAQNINFPYQFSSAAHTIRNIPRVSSKHSRIMKHDLFCGLGAAGVPLASLDDMTLVNKSDVLVDYTYIGLSGMSPATRKLFKSLQLERADYRKIDPYGNLIPAGEKVNAAKDAFEKAGKNLAFANRALAAKTISVMKAYNEENGTKVSY